MSQTQVLRVSAGAADYTWPGIITDESGRPLNPSQVKVALIAEGDERQPPSWQAGVVTAITASQVSAQLWVDSTTVPPGTYHVWYKITDSPVVEPMRGARLIIT
jgi:hypothetical protein